MSTRTNQGSAAALDKRTEAEREVFLLTGDDSSPVEQYHIL